MKKKLVVFMLVIAMLPFIMLQIVSYIAEPKANYDLVDQKGNKSVLANVKLETYIPKNTLFDKGITFSAQGAKENGKLFDKVRVADDLILRNKDLFRNTDYHLSGESNQYIFTNERLRDEITHNSIGEKIKFKNLKNGKISSVTISWIPKNESFFNCVAIEVRNDIAFVVYQIDDVYETGGSHYKEIWIYEIDLKKNTILSKSDVDISNDIEIKDGCSIRQVLMIDKRLFMQVENRSEGQASLGDVYGIIYDTTLKTSNFVKLFKNDESNNASLSVILQLYQGRLYNILEDDVKKEKTLYVFSADNFKLLTKVVLEKDSNEGLYVHDQMYVADGKVFDVQRWGTESEFAYVLRVYDITSGKELYRGNFTPKLHNSNRQIMFVFENLKFVN